MEHCMDLCPKRRLEVNMRSEKEVRKIGNCAHWENHILKANPELIPGSFHLSPSWLNILCAHSLGAFSFDFV